MKRFILSIILLLLANTVFSANKTVTVKATGGDYTTLNAALAGESGNLVAAACVLTIECYPMVDNTRASTGSGYITSGTYYLHITSPIGQRHLGVWDNSKYILRNISNGSDILEIYRIYTMVDYLQVEVLSETNWAHGIYLTNSIITERWVKIDSVIIKGNPSGTTNEVRGISYAGNGITNITNSLFYDFVSTNEYTGAIRGATGNLLRIYNTTIHNTSIGIYNGTGGGIVYVKNVGFSSVTQPIINYGTLDNTTCSTSTPVFISASVPYNLHLDSADNVWTGQGTDLSGDAYPFTGDMDGETRSSPWSIGADQYIAASSGPADNKRVILSTRCWYPNADRTCSMTGGWR